MAQLPARGRGINADFNPMGCHTEALLQATGMRKITDKGKEGVFPDVVLL